MNGIDLANWCGPHDPRDFCRSPWRAGGFLYATNGCRCIRIADDGRDLPETPAGAPTEFIDAILAEAVDGASFRLPLLPATRYAACSRCDGMAEVIDLVRVLDHAFQLRYLNDLPPDAVCGFLAPRDCRTSSGAVAKAQPLVARGDGWGAAVMGVRPDDYDLVHDVRVDLVA